MLDKFNDEVIFLLECAEEEMISMKHPYVGSEHLLLSLLNNDELVKSTFKKVGITYTKFKNALIKLVGKSSIESEYVLYTPLLRKILNDCIKSNKDNINGISLLEQIIKQRDGIAISVLKVMKVDINMLQDVLLNYNCDTISKTGYLMNSIVNNDKVINRDVEIDEIVNILLKRDKCNPILVGNAGVGKSVLVEELVRRINFGKVPKKLLNTNVFAVNLANLVSGTKYRGDFEKRFKDIIEEVIKSKAILFIDEIHGLGSCGNSEGSISAAEILKPYLTKRSLRVIGATTEREYNAYIVKDKALSRRFDLVKVNEPDDDSTYQILKNIKRDYELFHEVLIDNKVLESIISISGKYMKNRYNPDRSIELLDLVCSRLRMKKIDGGVDNYKVELNDIYNVINDKFSINVNRDINAISKSFSSIVGQDVVKSKLLKLLEYKFKNDGEVMSALLIGNTGVGKSEIVKIVASSLGNNSLIKLDMSEYYLDSSISKLIGTTSGYVGYNDTYEFEKVKLNPFSVILVDEVEKASPKVMNLFLSILDEGYIKDGCGDLIDFRNTIIFFTSNLASKKGIGFTNSRVSNLEEFFTPELIGRFDSIIEFDDIKEEDVINYVKNLNTNVSVEEVLSLCNYKKYGLRNVKKVIKSLECSVY